MALFDPPSMTQPTRWREFSLDYKLIYVYEICVLALSMCAPKLSVKRELLFTAVPVAILVSISLLYRQTMNWHWPGVNANGVLNASVASLTAGAFEYAGTYLQPPSDPRSLPAHLFALGIFASPILRALNVVQPTKTSFLKYCEAAEPPQHSPSMADPGAAASPVEPVWKKAVRTTYGLVFQLVSLDMAALFYFLGVALRNGSPKPTAAQPDSLFIAERYVRHAERFRLEVLLAVWVIGMASLALSGLILHYFLSIRIFPDLRTRQDRTRHI